MALPTRPLGAGDVALSTLGLGTSWVDGLDAAQLDATLHHAVELGVDWLDTAPIYARGESERRVGRVLAALPASARPLVVTKCGLQWDPRPEGPRCTLDAAGVRRELEGSLRRLGRDELDVYLVHWPPTEPVTPLEEYWQAMVELRAEGKVRAIGLSNHDVEQLERAQAIGRVDVVEPPFSAIRRGAAAELAWCAAHGAGAIVYSPMQSGLLTGAFTRERLAALPPDDWHHRDPEFTTELDANLALGDALAPIAERHGVTRGAVAIAWTLAWPGTTGAIAGARTPQQVDGWIAGGDLRLTDEDLDEIAAAIERTGAGDGPARPPR